MKVTLNGIETMLEDIAFKRDELPLFIRLGSINYLNYLRVYKSIDVNPVDD